MEYINFNQSNCTLKFKDFKELIKFQKEIEKQDKDTAIALTCHFIGKKKLRYVIDYEMLPEFEDETIDCDNFPIMVELNKITAKLINTNVLVNSYLV